MFCRILKLGMQQIMHQPIQNIDICRFALSTGNKKVVLQKNVKSLNNFKSVPSRGKSAECIDVKIGIIGGSGFNDPDIIEDRKEKQVKTPFGSPSDVLILGKIKGVECVLLARHGRKHSFTPGAINYQANIWALKEAGCTHLLTSLAVGSLHDKYKPGDLVIASDYIDRTTHRKQTFHDGKKTSPPGVCHLPMTPPFNERVRSVIISTACDLGFNPKTKATVVCTEGPRYSSPAENAMYVKWGGDLINMTIVPECCLAKEAGLLYSCIAIVTDDASNSDAKEVLKTFAANIEKVKKIVKRGAENIGKEDWTDDICAARNLVKSNNLL